MQACYSMGARCCTTPVLASGAVLLVITLIALAIIHQEEISDYFCDLRNHPDEHTQGWMMLGGACVAASLGLCYLVKKTLC